MHVFGFAFHGERRLARVQINKTVLFVLLAICVLSTGMPAFAKTPVVGATAPDFTLSTPSGKGGDCLSRRLATLTATGCRLKMRSIMSR